MFTIAKMIDACIARVAAAHARNVAERFARCEQRNVDAMLAKQAIADVIVAGDIDETIDDTVVYSDAEIAAIFAE